MVGPAAISRASACESQILDFTGASYTLVVIGHIYWAESGAFE